MGGGLCPPITSNIGDDMKPKLKTPNIYFNVKLGDSKKPNMGGFRRYKDARKASPCIVTTYRNGVAVSAIIE